jgi:carboxyl-terminal processing protease
LALSAAFAAGYITHARAAQANSDFPVLLEVRDILKGNFLGELPDDNALAYGAAHGMIGTLGDPYSRFVEPPVHELESNNLSGAFGGVGAELRYNDAGMVVLSPFPDLPAARAGLVDGDVLLAVDGVEITHGQPLNEVSALIRGPVGTQVRLTVQHDAEPPREFTIRREEFEIPSVTWRLLESQPHIGLLAISRFSGRTAEEVTRAYEELQEMGATSLILDLRDNSGGLLDASVEVAGAFLDGGIVAYETRRNGGEKTLTAAGRGVAADIPLVVLINHGTASAAEIVAGALLDRQRAPLIGEATFGKGSVQLVFDLQDGSSVHVTSARWYTPERTALDGQGLTPTFETPARDGALDPPLDRAITYLLEGG